MEVMADITGVEDTMVAKKENIGWPDILGLQDTSGGPDTTEAKDNIMVVTDAQEDMDMVTEATKVIMVIMVITEEDITVVQFHISLLLFSQLISHVFTSIERAFMHSMQPRKKSQPCLTQRSMKNLLRVSLQCQLHTNLKLTILQSTQMLISRIIQLFHNQQIMLSHKITICVDLKTNY